MTSVPRRPDRYLITPTQRLERLLSDAGGSLDRAEAFRRLAPQLGMRETRLALGLSIAARLVVLDDDDRLHLVDGVSG